MVDFLGGSLDERDAKRYHVETNTTKTFENDLQIWAIGLPKTEQVKGWSPNDGDWQKVVLAERSYEWDSAGRLIRDTTNNIGSQACGDRESDTSIVYEYTTDGLPKFVSVETDGIRRRSTTLTYDSLRLCVASASTPVTSYVRGAPTGTVHLEHRATCDYRTLKPASRTDPNGSRQEWVYDSRGRVREEREGSRTLRSHQYVDRYPTETMSTTWVGVDSGEPYYTRTLGDAAGRTLASVRWSSDSVRVRTAYSVYDAWGRRIRTYRPKEISVVPTASLEGLAPTAQERSERVYYDAFGRMVERVVPRAEGDVSYYYNYYNSIDGMQMVESPMGNLTNVYSDIHGRTTQIVAGGGASDQSFMYDSLGRLVSVKSLDLSGGRIASARRIERDGAGRPAVTTLPYDPNRAEQSETKVCFDGEGRPMRVETAGGRVVTYHRDELGRPVSVKATSTRFGDAASTTITYSYDTSTRGKGRLAAVESELGAQRVELYDSRGRPLEVVFTPSTDLRQQFLQGTPERYYAYFDYTDDGRPKSISYQARQGSRWIELGTYQYTLDAVGRTKELRGPEGPLVRVVDYDAEDRPRMILFGNGANTQWDYSPFTGEITSISHAHPVAGQLAGLVYRHDSDGRLTFESRTPGGLLKHYRYDPAGRLASAEVWGSNETYSYDVDGNIRIAGEDYYSYELPYTRQAVTRVESPAGTRQLTYDLDGLMVEDASSWRSRTFAYDGMGCLRQVDETSESQSFASSDFWCDPSGNLLFRATIDHQSGEQERILYLPGGLEVRPDERGGPTGLIRISAGAATVVEDARLLADGSINNEVSGYLHKDLRGSIVAKTAGPTFSMLSEADYDPWGNMLAIGGPVGLPDAHAFVDHEPDLVHGLYHFGPRTYDPTLRRWLSPDPLIRGSPEQGITSPNELNLYAYAANAPTHFIDPSGTRIVVHPEDTVAQEMVARLAAHPAFQERIETLELREDVVIEIVNWDFDQAGVDRNEMIRVGGAYATPMTELGNNPPFSSSYRIGFKMEFVERISNAAGLGNSDSLLTVGAHELSGHVGGAVIDGHPTHIEFGGETIQAAGNNEIAVSEENKLRGDPATCSVEKRRTHGVPDEYSDAVIDERFNLIMGR